MRPGGCDGQKRTDSMEDRISDLNAQFTFMIYESISRSLFQVRVNINGIDYNCNILTLYLMFFQYFLINLNNFQDHVLVFSFILCVGVLRERGEIQDDVWTFFLNLQSKKAAGAHTEVGALNLKPEPSGKKGNSPEKNYLLHTFYYSQTFVKFNQR